MGWSAWPRRRLNTSLEITCFAVEGFQSRVEGLTTEEGRDRKPTCKATESEGKHATLGFRFVMPSQSAGRERDKDECE